MTDEKPINGRVVRESMTDSFVDSFKINALSGFDFDPFLNVRFAQLRIFSVASSID